jgi:sulfotransferase family protein
MVTIGQEESTEGSGPPIFIVGCQRSGTTLVRLMLDSHPNISCGPETRFLEDLARLTERNWSYLRNYGFPQEYWDRKFAELFDSFQRNYAQSRGKIRWADKTPRYALSLDYIMRLFPTCQIVHVVRDGRDVVASHRDRWGYWSAIKAVEKWPRYIRAARAAGSSLPSDRYYEIRYEAVVRETEPALRRLLEFLNEPWDPAVLEHDEHPHDIAEHYAGFVATRRSAADTGAPVYSSRVGAHSREIDPLLEILIRLRAGRTLAKLGYR